MASLRSAKWRGHRRDERNECMRWLERCHLHDRSMKLLISSGEAKTTDARSPCMPAPTITGLPGRGPPLLESVLKRRLNSQTLFTLPSAVFTVYVSRQCSIEVTCPSAGAFLRSGLPLIAPRRVPAGALPSETDCR